MKLTRTNFKKNPVETFQKTVLFLTMCLFLPKSISNLMKDNSDIYSFVVFLKKKTKKRRLTLRLSRFFKTELQFSSSLPLDFPH